MLLKRNIINIKNISSKYIFKKYKRFSSKQMKKQISKFYKILLIIFFILIIFCLFRFIYKLHRKSKYETNDLTLVTAYYRIKSKHSPEEYFKWINNIVLLNKPMVFYSNKEFMPTIKKLRPKKLYDKTVFIELEMEEFYSYKNFYKEFKEAFPIDHENSYHTIPLYLVWAEKATFVKKAILNNYFHSKCFYWIDAGIFRDDNMTKFTNWPSTNKCFEDNRVLFDQIRQYSEKEIEGIIKFDRRSHDILRMNHNIDASMFGGQKEKFLKFIDLYYNAIRLFIKHNLFIGKDQNIFSYVAFAHPDVVKLKRCRDFFDFQSYLA